MDAMWDEALRRGIRRRLAAWYAQARRDLPWRSTAEPYRVWVSEIMLQQTRVEAVLPYYERFMREFPDVQSLAAAPLEQVLKAWERLGYYSRARNLHRAAGIIAHERDGAFPENAREWQALPGVGRYTAGAIASICYGEPAPVVDGNVKRVLARLFAIETPIESSAALESIWELAQWLVPRRRPGDFNQAMMELGAIICLPKSPSCHKCPLENSCEGCKQNMQAMLPIKTRKKPVPHKKIVAGVIERRGRLLLGRRPEEGMLGGLWEFPGGKIEPGESPEEALRRELREECAVDIEVGEQIASVRHAYSHFSITLSVYRCRIAGGRLRARYHTQLAWVPREALRDYPLPAANLKFVDKV